MAEDQRKTPLGLKRRDLREFCLVDYFRSSRHDRAVVGALFD
jgi:hypothetical protein